MPGQTSWTSTLPPRPHSSSASMEGRAIARPNLRPGDINHRRLPLQWRAGQLPGQTQHATPQRRDPRSCFNGGPGNCPAKQCTRASADVAQRRPRRFNGGPGNCPAKPGASSGSRLWRPGFNGGPDNCPAKLRVTARLRPRCGRFNGGPGNCPAKHVGQQRRHARRGRHRFNGGPGNCPAKPGLSLGPAHPFALLCFNGGPGNCPAKRQRVRAALHPFAQAKSFNGGAGQLPGQTRHDRDARRPSEPASMEGRAIARPNPKSQPLVERFPFALQWRAGQLPGQTTQRPLHLDFNALGNPGLQWRAGQLPGQTAARVGSGYMPADLLRFNGGPGNCPAKLRSLCRLRVDGWGVLVASMEGRAIARPNRGFPDPLTFYRWIQASMEGRAIARPNSPSHRRCL